MIGEGGASTWGVEDNEMTEELQKEAKVTQPDHKEVTHTTGTLNATIKLSDIVDRPELIKILCGLILI